MSLFGYPATITHFMAKVDNWGRISGYDSVEKNAKVVEEQKEVKNGRGEEIQSIAEIHLEGANKISSQDYFEYINAFGDTIRYEVKHYEIKKNMGTDDVKKVVVYA
jgi:hypothetical protein